MEDKKVRRQPEKVDEKAIDRLTKRLSTIMESRSLEALRSGQSADPEGVAHRKAYDALMTLATYLGLEVECYYPDNPPPDGSDE